MNANQFILLLNKSVSPLVERNRTIVSTFSKGFSPGPGRGSLTINFINLPLLRYMQRRGGGAEAENNRQLFMVWNFNEDPESQVTQVKLEQSINGIGSSGAWAPKLRAKTGSPDKVAAYLAKYLNDVAAKFEPNYTHE